MHSLEWFSFCSLFRQTTHFNERMNECVHTLPGSGMFSLILDTLRAQVIRIDQITQRYGRCSCCFWKSQSGKWLLPPKPIISAVRRGKDRSRDRSVRKQMYCPKKPSKLAIAVQGRNAGAVSRLLAFGLDQGLLVAIFSIVLIIVTDIAELVAENEQNTQSANDGEDTIVTEST